MNIFCVGRNYAAHAKELGNDLPEEPVIFMKPATALWSGTTPFLYPTFTKELHHEIELVIRISKNGRNIPENQASDYYNAISLGIDFTARDIQADLKKKGLPWEKAKAWDDSAVLGKWIDVSDERLSKPFHFSLLKNGSPVQVGDSTNMIFSFDKIIANISTYFSLNIGDLIYTGTPEGVGECVTGDLLEGFLEKEKMFDLTIK
jgi:2-keto-4-pentenoate hydratase/2-oxohepta-3-ene-1,7-dioic acid hydratase in catechol pathway